MIMRTVFAFCLTLLLALPVLAATVLAATQEQRSIEVWKSPTCGCCGKWVKHLEDNGFTVKVDNTSSSMLTRIKRQAGIEKEISSCHTAKIGGYVIEGHVSADDIKRLVKERPDAIGLTVPNMPIGSPGMEQPDGKTVPYDVLLVNKDGSLDVFARH